MSSHFGAGQVFRDLERISPGERFPRAIEQALTTCDALVALIGPSWSSIPDENGRRRLDDPKDTLRLEIAGALAREDVLVIPVLINATVMPRADELPEPLSALAEYNALRITDEGWDDQVARLIRELEKVVRVESAARSVPAPQPPTWDPAPPPQPPYRPAPAPPPPRQRSALPGVMGLFVLLLVLGVLAGLVFGGVKLVSLIRDEIPSGTPTVVLSPTSGRPGTAVNVTGTGYAKEETVEIRFHATEVGTTLTGPDGAFSARITIPATPFRNQQFDISATGVRSIRRDSAPFMVL